MTYAADHVVLDSFRISCLTSRLLKYEAAEKSIETLNLFVPQPHSFANIYKLTDVDYSLSGIDKKTGHGASQETTLQELLLY